MKKILAVILVVCVVILGAIIALNTVKDDEEMQRVDLYVRAMKSAFEAENGGNEFIAIKLDTLEGLSSVGEKIVLKEFENLSPNVYDFEDVKDDKSKFEFEGEDPSRAINGSVTIVEYDATFVNGAWELTETSMSTS